MNTPALTPREGAVFDFIYDELADGSPSPTLAEIATEVTEFGHSFRERVELDYRCRRGAATLSPAVARVLASVRAQLGQLRASDQAAVLAGLGAS